MYTGLSNGGRIIDGRMMVRSVSVHSSANAASETRTDLWIQALPRLYCITPTTCIDIDFGARPYFFYYSLCINYLLCNDFLLLLLLLSPLCTIFCAQENDPAGLYPLTSPRLDGGLRQHFITPCQGLRHHSAVLHWPCYVTTSECRAPCSATSGPAWGMEPCPASSSDRVVNTEHINQLSCLHAQSFKFLTCARFDQALYFFGKKVACKNFPCPNFVCTYLTRYPRSLYLGASLTEAY